MVLAGRFDVGHGRRFVPNKIPAWRDPEHTRRLVRPGLRAHDGGHATASELCSAYHRASRPLLRDRVREGLGRRKRGGTFAPSLKTPRFIAIALSAIWACGGGVDFHPLATPPRPLVAKRPEAVEIGSPARARRPVKIGLIEAESSVHALGDGNAEVRGQLRSVAGAHGCDVIELSRTVEDLYATSNGTPLYTGLRRHAVDPSASSSRRRRTPRRGGWSRASFGESSSSSRSLFLTAPRMVVWSASNIRAISG